MTSDPVSVPVEVHAPHELPDARRAEIRELLAELARATDEPIQGVRLTLRRPETRVARSRWVADASLLLNGRPLAAHATGQDAGQAAKAAAGRLRRQIRRVADAGTALRNEPRAIEKALAGLAERRERRPRPPLKPPELPAWMRDATRVSQINAPCSGAVDEADATAPLARPP